MPKKALARRPSRQATGGRMNERRWALVRLVLGFAQVFGASLGAGLLLQVGATKLTLVVTMLTGLCSIASVLLFRVWRLGGPRLRS